LNGDIEQRVKNNLSLSFEGIDGESLLYAFSRLSVSSTSACASASIEPSYVIKSLGVEDSLAHSTVRLSFGRFTADSHVDAAIQLITEQVKRLRGLYGL
jgi:cysteine desulfurase